MSRALFLLRVEQHETREGTRRTLIIEDQKTKEQIQSVFFDLIGEQDFPQPKTFDGFLFGVLFYCMQSAQKIHIEGSVSRAALRNMREFQEAWHLWRPDRYAPLTITADEYVETWNTSSPRAIAAFSGGVDSIFTTLRHASKWRANAGDDAPPCYDLSDSVLMVHGFDVPLDRMDELDALQARVTGFLDANGLKLRTIRTNLKRLAIQNWEDSHAAQLACCLHNYSHLFDACLIGSTDPYKALVLPWGSNPATDHLLSGAAMRTVHDGAGFTRTQKIARLAQDPVATAAVKVCWEGDRAAENCGRCEKCVRTQLAFKAVGIEQPACFDTDLDDCIIRDVRLPNEAAAARMMAVLEFARDRDIKASWMTALEQRMAKYRSGVRKNVVRRTIGAGRRRMNSLVKAVVPPALVARSP